MLLTYFLNYFEIVPVAPIITDIIIIIIIVFEILSVLGHCPASPDTTLSTFRGQPMCVLKMGHTFLETSYNQLPTDTAFISENEGLNCTSVEACGFRTILFYYHYCIIISSSLHNEELNDLYSSPNIVRVIKWRRMRWAGHVARMGEERGAYRVLVGKPEGRRPLGRPRRRWMDIRMDLQEVGCGYMD
jgi:hypothetical protein